MEELDKKQAKNKILKLQKEIINLKQEYNLDDI